MPVDRGSRAGPVSPVRAGSGEAEPRAGFRSSLARTLIRYRPGDSRGLSVRRRVTAAAVAAGRAAGSFRVPTLRKRPLKRRRGLALGQLRGTLAPTARVDPNLERSGAGHTQRHADPHPPRARGPHAAPGESKLRDRRLRGRRGTAGRRRTGVGGRLGRAGGRGVVDRPDVDRDGDRLGLQASATCGWPSPRSRRPTGARGIARDRRPRSRTRRVRCYR